MLTLCCIELTKKYKFQETCFGKYKKSRSNGTFTKMLKKIHMEFGSRLEWPFMYCLCNVSCIFMCEGLLKEISLNTKQVAWEFISQTYNIEGLES